MEAEENLTNFLNLNKNCPAETDSIYNPCINTLHIQVPQPAHSNINIYIKLTQKFYTHFTHFSMIALLQPESPAC